MANPIFAEPFDQFEPYKISSKAMRSEITMFDQKSRYEGPYHMFQQQCLKRYADYGTTFGTYY